MLVSDKLRRTVPINPIIILNLALSKHNLPIKITPLYIEQIIKSMPIEFLNIFILFGGLECSFIWIVIVGMFEKNTIYFIQFV